MIRDPPRFKLTDPLFPSTTLFRSVVADKTGLSKADATKSVDCVFDAITDSLKTGDEVRLVGFGTFTVSQRAASEGRNPRTGERIQIPASKQPKFKAGKGQIGRGSGRERVGQTG